MSAYKFQTLIPQKARGVFKDTLFTDNQWIAFRVAVCLLKTVKSHSTFGGHRQVPTHC